MTAISSTVAWVLCDNTVKRLVNSTIVTTEHTEVSLNSAIKSLTTGGIDIIQPDLSHAGGIWEVRKIAAMAEAWDVAVAPHCPLGPIALAASLQLDFCTPNSFIQEQSLGIHYNQGSDVLDYLVDPGEFVYEECTNPRGTR